MMTIILIMMIMIMIIIIMITIMMMIKGCGVSVQRRRLEAHLESWYYSRPSCVQTCVHIVGLVTGDRPEVLPSTLV